MSATTARMIVDAVGQLIPQYYDPVTDTYVACNQKTALAAFLVAGGAAQTGTAISFPSGRASFQAVANGSSGAFAATVTIKVSNDGTNYETIGTIALSGTATTAASGSFTNDAPYAYVRADVTGFSGTGATCNVTMVI